MTNEHNSRLWSSINAASTAVNICVRTYSAGAVIACHVAHTCPGLIHSMVLDYPLLNVVDHVCRYAHMLTDSHDHIDHSHTRHELNEWGDLLTNQHEQMSPIFSVPTSIDTKQGTLSPFSSLSPSSLASVTSTTSSTASSLAPFPHVLLCGSWADERINSLFIFQYMAKLRERIYAEALHFKYHTANSLTSNNVSSSLSAPMASSGDIDSNTLNNDLSSRSLVLAHLITHGTHMCTMDKQQQQQEKALQILFLDEITTSVEDKNNVLAQQLKEQRLRKSRELARQKKEEELNSLIKRSRRL